MKRRWQSRWRGGPSRRRRLQGRLSLGGWAIVNFPESNACLNIGSRCQALPSVNLPQSCVLFHTASFPPNPATSPEQLAAINSGGSAFSWRRKLKDDPRRLHETRAIEEVANMRRDAEDAEEDRLEEEELIRLEEERMAKEDIEIQRVMGIHHFNVVNAPCGPHRFVCCLWPVRGGGAPATRGGGEEQEEEEGKREEEEGEEVMRHPAQDYEEIMSRHCQCSNRRQVPSSPKLQTL